VLGRIQHHSDNALDVTVDWRQAINVDSKPTRNRVAHLIRIELFPLYLARFENILS
jgi:hypothetical protein